MANFKIGCSPLTSKIFAGKVLTNGAWSANRQDVTESAPAAVAQHLMQLDESLEFTHRNGKRYRLQVVEVGHVCPKCDNPHPHVSKNGDGSCEDCGHTWMVG